MPDHIMHDQCNSPTFSSATAPGITIAGGFSSSYGPHDDTIGTSHTGSDGKCTLGTVTLAGAAFHAGVRVYNVCLPVPHDQNLLWTYLSTHSAADTFVRIVRKRGDIR